ncbi:MAG: amidohydrolase family protein [Methanobacteriaceae archaeon]|nr:amidohydrolase family protein [Methanobacteriaceae archaeon]
MLVIENGLVLTGRELNPEKVNIAIEDGVIQEITPEKISSSDKIDASGCIVLPSFINAHTHIGDAVAMDEGDGKSIDDIVKPPNGIKHQILESSSSQNLIQSMKNAMWEMLDTGTTTFIDYREGGIDGIKLLEKASEDIPINKIVLGRDPVIFDSEASDSEVRSKLKKILKHCDGIAPSGFGEITDETAKIIVEECEKQGKIASIHVAEHEKVQKDSIVCTGKSEVERAVESGFKLLIHFTHPQKRDFNAISSIDASIVCCSRSNGTLSVGIPPISDILHNKINILLGTDNLMFNSPNMFREMEYALKTTRGYSKKYLSPSDVLKMATTNVSKAIDIDSGIIKEDCVADIMLVKQLSKNPWLSIINRTESKNIICLIRKGKIVYMR